MTEEKSKYYIWQSFFLGLAAAIGLFAGLHIQQPKENKKNDSNVEKISSPDNSQKWIDVMSFVHAKYIDTLSDQVMMDKAIDGFLSNLDPYSAYYSTQEAETIQNEIEGDYKGLGIECLGIDKKIYVSSIFPGSPAQKSNLKIGDQIVAINQTPIDTTIDVQQWTMDFIRKSGDSLSLSIKSHLSQEKRILIQKSEINIPSVDLAYKPYPNMIYVKLNIIGEQTYREFMEAIETNYDNKQSKFLILDLRDNTGGLVHIAADILNQLVKEKDQLLFTTKNKNHEKEYRSLGRPFFKFDKIVVLINQNTASAAEIISGSLQDMGIAYVIGMPSLGKGTLLEQFTLNDQSMIRLAVGRFYLPSGRCPQKPYNHENLETEEIQNDAKKQSWQVDHSGIIPNEKIQQSINSEETMATLRNYSDKISFSFLLNQNFSNDHIHLGLDNEMKDWLRNSIKKEKLDSIYNLNAELFQKEFKYSLIYQTQGRKMEWQERLKNDAQFLKAIAYLQKK